MAGAVVMGLALPTALFYLLDLHTVSQWVTLAASIFLTWGVTDLLSSLLSRPRLANRTPQQALHDWEHSKREE